MQHAGQRYLKGPNIKGFGNAHDQVGDMTCAGRIVVHGDTTGGARLNEMAEHHLAAASATAEHGIGTQTREAAIKIIRIYQIPNKSGRNDIYAAYLQAPALRQIR